ncbi:preprotein translocase subunit SecY [Spiroplasma endosymbiont of Amphibalanus improvisus]|uniref:preprotein translocase subunit SecY n=1 Tax=Spiroplasma endosymbiont of Amphibalanus improvisus TaxID=3066327 RepID=UPI00313D2C7D
MKKLKNKKNTNLEFEDNFFVKNKDLIKRVAFTLFILFIIRLGSYLTVPGIIVNTDLNDLSSENQFFALISMLGGGTLGKFSILALGVSPYITASIIVQLLSTDVIPVMSRWAKSGDKGRKKLDNVTKILTIPFALAQGVATIFTVAQNGAITPKWTSADYGAGPPIFYYILVPCILLAGTMFMLWLADQLSIKGLGNGVSLIIFGGIVAKLPYSIVTTFNFWVSPTEQPNVIFDGFLKFFVYMVMFVLVILFVVILNESERKIPIQQTGSSLTASNSYNKNKPYLPLRINCAGVIPVIFASALISAPVTIAQIIQTTNPDNGFVTFCNTFLSFSTWWGIGVYGLLTILFTFLYSQIQINPEKISDNFQKSGTFIPGVKPGKETEKYLKSTVFRLSIIGSLFLTSIAILPYVIAKLTNLPSALAIGGTGLIIMVSVALQTVRQIQGRLVQHSFINKRKQIVSNSKTKNKEMSHIW